MFVSKTKEIVAIWMILVLKLLSNRFFSSSTDDGGGVDADADHALSVGVLDDGLGDDLLVPFRGQIAIYY